ncbi:NYN domain-containing protein [Anaerolinea sp.]|uniref:NYN domain-containing protein n=1 Tax=Anaerolinea sp. TaxID=1872519 RepID=UPI002ACE4519|nr:NYN domain-containing protein [Anaerolinea sp.]
MIYLIDGHNLIPHLPGLNLAQIEDENRLIALLQDFARQSRCTVEVFFDKAPPGRAGKRRAGNITAHWIEEGKTADSAIIAVLQRLGKRAVEVTVVTSDRQILAEARNRRAKTLSSAEFARQLLSARTPTASPSAEKPDKPSENEVEEFLNLFRKKKDK